ncbi:PREDICTED: LEAF RUST 10 DISEASE-RESISTANCE LOCUS RECEPTOR-LIKE PROTEIN KINASE-like 1.2 isoform X1 [Tarenaya hassleriana]|uniref:LEAF RUST 10 DISEASE-RESISTANCE LOCUS RECEPTOR-LIKE PROTEIN KINASE-like 1.2 isoform X1 n=1 Tax=Tarenaya hassleriana TaxID=28532 RepID=UPI00053C4EDE|nr:PREDICTED: LEAF RUST 10 DISEASE-RESISTANCE LOCUS RECEPTOR-LIKE PROTEIN KINASE-like 1.2 isoform X1 [Tarenaya hassleriana]
MDPPTFFFFLFTYKRCLHERFIVSIFYFTLLSTRTLSLDPKFEACEPKSCGNGPIITYPFYLYDKQEPFCGYPNFEIACNDSEFPVLSISGEEYIIRTISYTSQSFLAVNSLAYQDPCPRPLHNLTLHRTPFSVSPSHVNFTLAYDCVEKPEKVATFPVDCASNNTHRSFGIFRREYVAQEGFSFGSCQKFVDIPVAADSESDANRLMKMSYVEILKTGFVLNWTAHSCLRCKNSGGRCGSDKQEFICLCPNGQKAHSSCKNGGINWKVKICIGVVAGFAGISATSAACYFYYRRKIRRYRTSSVLLPKNITSEPSSKNSDMEKAEELLAGVRVFTYEELEEATNNFDPSKELGDGGFGTVYYGQLKDGRSVAVKRLYENNYKRVEQFRNEVEILARLRHPNLVTLFGCSSKHSRDLLLVYEFIPNGTLADHLHGPRANPSALPWSTRLKIAAETANALKYLHASEIIHRDVKSNNILLDRNFNVKVADFGLSRLFPMDRTHVSTSPQGTPGYLDPDYHQCYQLTSKSDVFSFGVVLMELISSMPAVDITRHRHEINLSKMAIVKIQSHSLHEMVDSTLGFETDAKVRDSVSSVAELAFQCLQSDKDLRPDISQVLETLTRIRNDGFDLERADEIIDVGVANDDDDDDGAVMMKSGQLVTSSPNTVMVKWDSSKE